MTIAIDRSIQSKPLSFDEFLLRYGNDNRYELIDGEVFDLEPTGPHEGASSDSGMCCGRKKGQGQ